MPCWHCGKPLPVNGAKLEKGSLQTRSVRCERCGATYVIEASMPLVERMGVSLTTATREKSGV